MKPKEFEVIYKFTVAPTVPFPNASNWDTEPIGELIRCKDCKYRKPKKTTNLNSHCLWYNRAVMADDYCSKAERKEE